MNPREKLRDADRLLAALRAFTFEWTPLGQAVATGLWVLAVSVIVALIVHELGGVK